ncbi:MAG: hypothetical protein R3C16_08975 [Hyphomonadaceae bacterium]
MASARRRLLKLINGELAPQSGAVSSQGRIAVLRQSLQPAPDATVADLFGARAALARLHRAETGQASADDVANADWTLETRLEAALARLGLAVRRRHAAQRTLRRPAHARGAAALVFAEPDFHPRRTHQQSRSRRPRR